jgi:hypothetical protein
MTRTVPAAVPFATAVHQNEYLPREGNEVQAIVMITADGPHVESAEHATEAAEVILVDCSGSMGHPWQKLRAARHATEVAIDALREGTWFSIVRAAHDAEPVYPRGMRLARASVETRKEAKAALKLLWPEGGTAMGQWLLLASELLATQPQAIPHVILLTDGKNESESEFDLGVALQRCASRFQCDCRGVGTEWEVAELRRIASSLLGTVDIVREPSALAADFGSMMQSAMAKRFGDARLRVWTPRGVTVRSVQQVAPQIQDLTGKRKPVDRFIGEYPTGAWGNETRGYQFSLRVPTYAVGDEMLAARVGLVVGDHVASQALVRAIWTDDDDLIARIDPQVAHYTGQSELARNVQDGLEARRRGQEDVATEKLGRAVQLAAVAGNDDTLRLLHRVVDVVDAPTGVVRLKAAVDLGDEMELDTRSARTVTRATASTSA